MTSFVFACVGALLMAVGLFGQQSVDWGLAEPAPYDLLYFSGGACFWLSLLVAAV